MGRVGETSRFLPTALPGCGLAGAGAFTTDKGATWHEIKGLSSNTRILADRVNPKKFYGMSLYEGKLFLSTDGAVSFVEQPFTLTRRLAHAQHLLASKAGSGWDRLYTTPGREGDLWVTALTGLYHSTDTGKTFTRMEGITELRGFGFGKGAPGANDPALYMVGVANGHARHPALGRLRATWVRINDDQHQFGLIGQITGDPKQYGRVYVGTFGRGIVYGDPVKKKG